MDEIRRGGAEGSRGLAIGKELGVLDMSYSKEVRTFPSSDNRPDRIDIKDVGSEERHRARILRQPEQMTRKYFGNDISIATFSIAINQSLRSLNEVLAS